MQLNSSFLNKKRKKKTIKICRVVLIQKALTFHKWNSKREKNKHTGKSVRNKGTFIFK